MKHLYKTLCTLVLLFALTGIYCSQAQTADRIDTSLRWIIHHSEYSESWPRNSHDYQFEVEGDTTINDTAYQKIWLTGEVDYSASPHGNSKTYVAWNQLYGYVRLTDGELYYRYGPGGNLANCGMYNADEYLVANFNFEVGDSILAHVGWGTEIYLKVRKIDSVEVGTDWKKRWVLESMSHPESAVWIEGIGPIQNGVLFGHFCHQFEDYSDMLCWSIRVNDSLYHPEPCELDYTIGIADGTDNRTLVLTRGDLPGEYQIQGLSGPAGWQLVTIAGQVANQGSFVPGQGKGMINLTGNRPGIYALRIFHKDKVEVFKLWLQAK